MAAILPERRERAQEYIENMEPGSSGWTVPWAMSVDEDGRCYLNSRYTIHPQPGGTVEMLVTRHGNAFHVDISQCRHTWDRSIYQSGSTWWAIPVESIKD